jgi:hypothetical protein
MDNANNVDVYYVDDPRNAGGDHRTGGGNSPWPAGALVQRPGAPRPMVQYAQPAQVAQARPLIIAQPAQPYMQQQYAQPYGQPWQQYPLFGGRLNLGNALDLVAETIAALWPLPDAPVTTGDIGTDVQNHVLYQTSLAQHTKRDERIRTLGVVMKRLIG